LSWSRCISKYHWSAWLYYHTELHKLYRNQVLAREMLGKQTISVMATDLKKDLPIHLKNQNVFYRSKKGLFTLGLRPDVKFFSKTKLYGIIWFLSPVLQIMSKKPNVLVVNWCHIFKNRICTVRMLPPFLTYEFMNSNKTFLLPFSSCYQINTIGVESRSFEFKPYVRNIYQCTLTRLKAADIDQEVKERAISCM